MTLDPILQQSYLPNRALKGCLLAKYDENEKDPHFSEKPKIELFHMILVCRYQEASKPISRSINTRQHFYNFSWFLCHGSSPTTQVIILKRKVEVT
jgi:hypothetical protein